MLNRGIKFGFGLIEFFGTLSSAAGSGGNISHIGHLGGLISGFIIIYYRLKHKGSSNKKSENKKNIISNTLKNARLKKKKHEIDTRIKAKKIIDVLLEKIARTDIPAIGVPLDREGCRDTKVNIKKVIRMLNK